MVVGRENVGARNEVIGAGLDEVSSVLICDASVDLNLELEVVLVANLIEFDELVHDLGDEFLTSEARVHTHQEDEVDLR